MAAFNAVVVAIAALFHLSQASGNEASSISAESVYRKVHFRVRDVVGMLENMQQAVMKDGENDAELFGKYMFYCRRGRAAIEASIEEAENTDIDELTSTLEGEEKTHNEMTKLIEEDQAKKADAEKAIKKAKSIRDYEAVVFAEESSKLRKDIASLKSAIRDDGLQQNIVFLLKQLSGSGDIQKNERELLASFLKRAKSGSEDAEPDSKEIHSVLAPLIEMLENKLSKIIEEEETEKGLYRDYKGMVRQKANDLKSVIEQKAEQVGDLESDMSSQKDTLEDASAYLMEGPAFLPYISEKENCTRREDEWADRCQIRTGELVTIADTISLLTDDALLEDMLKKSLPEPWMEPTHHALVASKQSGQKDSSSQFDLLSLALKGKNASFTKIFNVIDGMVAMLGKEQSRSNHAKEQQACGQSLNQTEENLKRLTLSVSDLVTVIAQHEKSIAQFSAKIAEVHAGIQRLDQEIVDSAAVRKQEHEVNAEILVIDNVTLHMARAAGDRLSAYYSEAISKGATPPMPDATGATLGDIIGPYQKKHEESKSIKTIIDATLTEMGSEIAKVTAKETGDENQWEELVKASLEKHANDLQAISERQGAKADLEALLETMAKDKKEKVMEVTATAKVLSELQGNNTGFLRPSVCSRSPMLPPHIEMPKNFIIW